MPDPQMPDRQVLPLSPDDLALWRGNLDKARAARTLVQKWADANVKAYAPSPSDDPDGYGTKVNTNRDFTLVERKKADLFYQRPDVTAIPSPLMEGQEAILETHTTILNQKLGLGGVHAKALVHRVLFDVLCPSGTGWTEMGYESATVPTPMQDPRTGETVMAPVPVYEDCFWTWFSPKQALTPHDAHTTDVDTWPWVGKDFEMPLRAAKRKGWVPDDFKGTASNPALHFDHGLGNTVGDAVVSGQMIYYKSALYRDDRVHPLHQTLLILIDGVETPAEHKDSPHQTLDPKGGLTPDSLLGFPIHPLTIRTLTDSAYVPSDCTISRPLVNELNTFREQMIQFRDAAVLRWMYNVDTLPPDALNKIVRSPVGGFIGVPGDAFVGEGSIKELPHGSLPRENFTINDYLDNDLARTHALDAEQSGASGNGDQTATEASIKQNNVNARLGFERAVTLDWYVAGCTKFSTLLMRYLTLEQATAIVGPQQAAAWDPWRHTVPAGLAFTALPDSAQRDDLAWERDRLMKEYSFFANDPYINREQLLKHLIPRLRYPQNVLNAQPPAKGPEPTKPGLSLRGEDLNPLMPQFPILIEVLGQCGITISAQAIQHAQEAAQTQILAGQVAAHAQAQAGAGPDTAHGGKVPQAENLSKHAQDITGNMQGTGQHAPLGPGGIQ